MCGNKLPGGYFLGVLPNCDGATTDYGAARPQEIRPPTRPIVFGGQGLFRGREDTAGREPSISHRFLPKNARLPKFRWPEQGIKMHGETEQRNPRTTWNEDSGQGVLCRG